jgi:hypothetical protein
MPRKLFAGLAVCAVFVLLSTTAKATTVERLSLQDLATRSQSIVQGIVRGSRSYWGPNGKLILTNTTIEVTESLKGQSPRTVEVTTVGGRIGDTILHVAGMPSFAPGESTIVFVEKSNGYNTVLGMEQGKFTVANGEVASTPSELNFVDGKPARISRMPEQVFKSQIRSMVERGH